MKKILSFLTILLSISSLVFAQDDSSLFPYYKTWRQKDLCFIDKTGKIVLEVPHKIVEHPYQQDGLFAQLKNNFFYEGYCLLNARDSYDTPSFLLAYNAKGELVKRMPDVRTCTNFHEGYAVVFTKDKYYTMNKKFELEKELPFKRIDFNAQGIGVVYQNGGYSHVRYYNTRGESLSDKIFEYQYDDFAHGTTRVKLDEKLTFLNKKMEVIAVATPQEMSNYPYITPTDGTIVLFNNVEGNPKGISRIIDKTGKEIAIKPELKAQLIAYVGDGLFVKRDEAYKCTFVNAAGKQMMRLPFNWDSDSRYENGLAWVRAWEEMPIAKRIIRQLINVKTGKVLFERKTAPSLIGSGVSFAFCGELTRVGFQYLDKKGKVVFTLPASCGQIDQLQDYALYAPEDIKYLAPDPYNVANEQYIAWQDFKGIEKVNPAYLRLSDWKFKELPKEVLNMTNLEELDLSFMKLTEIPTEIDKLKKLKKLDLGNNQIKRLPETLANLPLLTEVQISDNPYERNLNLPSISTDNGIISMSGGMVSYDGNGNAYSGTELEAREEAERKAREEKYREPDDLPVLSDKGASLVLWVLQNPPKRDTATIFKESKEADELINERQYEGQGMRRDVAFIYPLTLKRRKEIWAILKEKEKLEIERRKQKPDGRWGADVSTAVFYDYTMEKIFLYNKIMVEKVFFKEFNNVVTLKEKLPVEKSIRGFNLVKTVEEQLQQNVPEDTIKKDIRDFLEKEFEALLRR